MSGRKSTLNYFLKGFEAMKNFFWYTILPFSIFIFSIFLRDKYKLNLGMEEFLFMAPIFDLVLPVLFFDFFKKRKKTSFLFVLIFGEVIWTIVGGCFFYKIDLGPAIILRRLLLFFWILPLVGFFFYFGERDYLRILSALKKKTEAKR